MDAQDPIDLWLPDTPGFAFDVTCQQAVSDAILRAVRTSDQEVARLVNHLVQLGQHYAAGRCLEILAQHKLGLDLSGDELLNYHFSGFGTFHQVIYDLLRAGALYQQSGRQRTSRAAVRRALLFVEEAIRNIRGIPRGDNGELICLGIAFELAGHCCAALDDSDGIDYYHAAERYWGQAARLRPEALFQWSHHPVTQTVIRCLGPVVEIRPAQEVPPEELFAADYTTRIDSARRLLA